MWWVNPTIAITKESELSNEFCPLIVGVTEPVCQQDSSNTATCTTYRVIFCPDVVRGIQDWRGDMLDFKSFDSAIECAIHVLIEEIEEERERQESYLEANDLN